MGKSPLCCYVLRTEQQTRLFVLSFRTFPFLSAGMILFASCPLSASLAAHNGSPASAHRARYPADIFLPVNDGSSEAPVQWKTLDNPRQPMAA